MWKPVFIFIVFHWAGTKYDFIFVFSLLILQIDTLFYFIIESFKEKFYSVSHGITSENQSIFVFVVCAKYDLINVVWQYPDSCTLLPPPGRNKIQSTLQCFHVSTVKISLYLFIWFHWTDAKYDSILEIALKYSGETLYFIYFISSFR